jgi:hypothetical protein
VAETTLLPEHDAASHSRKTVTKLLTDLFCAQYVTSLQTIFLGFFSMLLSYSFSWEGGRVFNLDLRGFERGIASEILLACFFTASKQNGQPILASYTKDP